MKFNIICSTTKMHSQILFFFLLIPISQLKLTQPRQIACHRKLLHDKDAIERYFHVLEGIVSKFAIKDDMIVNYDEVCLQYNSKARRAVGIIGKESFLKEHLQDSNHITGGEWGP